MRPLAMGSTLLGFIMTATLAVPPPTTAQDPSPGTYQGHPLVGTWYIAADPAGPAGSESSPTTAILHADGSYIQSDPYTVGLGTWQPTGARAGSFTAVIHIVDTAGAISRGMIRGTAEVAPDGHNLTAIYTFEQVARDGTSSGEVAGSATGVRVLVEPMGSPAPLPSSEPGGSPGPAGSPTASVPSSPTVAGGVTSAADGVKGPCTIEYMRADNMWAAKGRPDGDLGVETLTLLPGRRKIFLTDWAYEKRRNDGDIYYGSHLRRLRGWASGQDLVHFTISDWGRQERVTYKALGWFEYKADLMEVYCPG